MLLGIVLLYVGAVLFVNGIWLIGSASAEPMPDEALARGESGTTAVMAKRRPNPISISNTEVAILNVFTGFVGVVAATTLGVLSQTRDDVSLARSGGFILLFAFTYLWVAFNQWVPRTDGHAFGWYCLFVAITAVPAGIYVLKDAAGNTASIWLGADWFAWAVLWFLFFLLLTLELPIARFTGVIAALEGIGTAWVFGFALLEKSISF
jgi:hypothetical protein